VVGTVLPSRPFNGVGRFMRCVWMGGNVFLYLMGWGGLGIRQTRVGAGCGGLNVRF
jgi:hypothetical protein